MGKNVYSSSLTLILLSCIGKLNLKGMKVMGILFVCVFSFLTNGAFRFEYPEKADAKYKLVEAFPGLTFDMPVELFSPADNTDRAFVVEQKGRIIVFQNEPDVTSASVFLDIVKNVDSGGEKGLLGLAFHPDYKSNGYFYVNYTRSSPLETVISRFKVTP